MCPGIASAQTRTAALPHWIFATEMISPPTRSLKRPEDGVVFPNVFVTVHQAFLTHEALDAIATITLRHLS